MILRFPPRYKPFSRILFEPMRGTDQNGHSLVRGYLCLLYLDCEIRRNRQKLFSALH